MGIGWRQNIGVDEVLHVPGAGAAMAAGKGAACLESCIFGHPEAISHSRHAMPAICVSGHILVGALQPDL